MNLLFLNHYYFLAQQPKILISYFTAVLPTRLLPEMTLHSDFYQRLENYTTKMGPLDVASPTRYAGDDKIS